MRWIGLALAILTVIATPVLAKPVRIDGGLVEGIRSDGLTVYKGIPFAAPPMGDLRWRAPQPVVPWTGVRQADRFSPVCMQDGAYPPDSPPEPSSEDCLYLNIWKPVIADSGKLPVMVWIYGGSLLNGSASTPLYFGDKLAQKGVIVVTFNYRLGIFGFLAYPELTKESRNHSSGNYGFLDQIAALDWVHRNIAAFGGDPERVTIFGQSSGSISISALTTSPLTKGLFQRAIGESGGLFEPLSLSDSFSLAGAEQQGQRFAAHAGATSISALRAEPATALMKIPFDGNIIVDGYVLTQSPYEAYLKGQQNNVDVLVGSNANEGQHFIANRSITIGNLSHELGRDFPGPLVWLIGPRPAVTDQEARASAAAFEGDMRFRWDMWTWARLAADHGKGKVFLYEFLGVPPYPAGSMNAGLGATHGTEMMYVFDHLDQQSLPWTAADRRLAAAMSTYWTDFAKTGDPNAAGLPAWPGFTSANQEIMLLGDEIKQGEVRNPGTLKQISRVYASARFIHGNFNYIVAVVVLALTALIAAIIAGVRRRRARHRGKRGNVRADETGAGLSARQRRIRHL